MSIYGKKVVAVLDTESTFGVKIKQLVDDVKTLMTKTSVSFSVDDEITLTEADNDQAAREAGVRVGRLYRTGNIVKVRIS